jgi:hypothetical protein
MSKQRRNLARWALIMAGDKGPVLAGCEPDGAEYRTSTPLVALDPVSGTAMTASGRQYRLLGDPDPRYALEALNALWNTDGVEVCVVGIDEAVGLVAGNSPFDRSAEEQAAIDAWKLPNVAGQIRLLMLRRGLDLERAAEVVGLEPGRLRSLLDGSAEGWTAGEADRVFDALAARGTADTGQALVRADISASIRRRVRDLGLSVEAAAGIAGLDAEVMRGIVERGETRGLSIERLDRVIEALDEAGERYGGGMEM